MSIISPFNGLHTDLKANFGDYCGWSLPSDYGDSSAECRQLYEHSAAFDLSAFGRISIGGEDAGALLGSLSAMNEKHGHATLMAQPADTIEDGKWVWGTVCDGDGKLVDIVRAAQAGSSYLILTSPGARHHVIAIAREIARENNLADVKINDQTEKTGMLGIYGPKAVESFDHIVPLNIAQMESQGVKSISLFMMSITVIRGGWLGLDGIEIFGGATACKLAAGAIEKYHKRENIMPAGMECLEIAATEASLPLVVTGQKLPGHFGCPATATLRLGRATQSDGNRTLVGIRSDGQAHTHKDLKVQFDGLEIGWTDRIVWSQKFGKTVGIAMVDNEMADLSDEVQITGDSVAMGGEIVQLPFDKEIAAGIYKN